MYFPVDPPGRCILGILSVELPIPSLLTVLSLFTTWTQVTFAVGVPPAAQSIVRSCPSLIILVEGGEVVNWGGTTKKSSGINSVKISLVTRL